MPLRPSLRLAVFFVGLLLSLPVPASFHLWTLNEIYSNADGSIQYIELTTTFGGQQFLTGHTITATTTGSPGQRQYSFTTDLPGDTTNHKFLIGTQGFAALNIVTPDYVVPNGFLGVPGGSVNFAGVDTVNYSAIPTDNHSIDRNGTPGTPTPTNFAGQTGVIPPCAIAACANLSVAHVNPPASSSTGRDILYTLSVSNAGPSAATNATLTDILPPGTAFIWASPPCSQAGGTVTCAIGRVSMGEPATVVVVVRASGAGSITNTASVSASELDSDSGNNQSVSTHTVATSPAGNPAQRYRLYSDITKEHLFTTDLNEYNVLGAGGGWTQEGGVGKVLDNPGSFGGVEAVPYYRLYDTATRWHHWTTDANEFYTLGYVYSGWNMEGVDGWILPTQAVGSTQLYRLNYPALGSLHHWTIDANEYNALITQFGWVGEGGSGFVVQ